MYMRRKAAKETWSFRSGAIDIRNPLGAPEKIIKSPVERVKNINRGTATLNLPRLDETKS